MIENIEIFLARDGSFELTCKGGVKQSSGPLVLGTQPHLDMSLEPPERSRDMMQKASKASRETGIEPPSTIKPKGEQARTPSASA